MAKAGKMNFHQQKTTLSTNKKEYIFFRKEGRITKIFYIDDEA